MKAKIHKVKWYWDPDKEKREINEDFLGIAEIQFIIDRGDWKELAKAIVYIKKCRKRYLVSAPIIGMDDEVLPDLESLYEYINKLEDLKKLIKKWSDFIENFNWMKRELPNIYREIPELIKRLKTASAL